MSLSQERLISGLSSGGEIVVEGAESQKAVYSAFNFVGPDFFDVMRMPVIVGRGIGLRDMAAASRVAVINQTLARRRFGSESPIGRKFRWSFRKDTQVEVIGVVKRQILPLAR